MTANPDDEVVSITAAARGRELRVENRPRTRIMTKGEGRVATRRTGLPPTGAEPGVAYPDVDVSVDIASDPASR